VLRSTSAPEQNHTVNTRRTYELQLLVVVCTAAIVFDCFIETYESCTREVSEGRTFKDSLP